MSMRYIPGTTPIAVTSAGFAVLDGDTPPAVAARILEQLRDGRGLAGVLEALTGAYGASLLALPPFAVAVTDGEATRVVVRGERMLEVEGFAGERISGVGVTTWNERVISSVRRVVFTERADPEAAEYPVADAVVFASALVWDVAGDAVSDGDAGATASAPADDPAPAIVSEPATDREPATTSAPTRETPLDEPTPAAPESVEHTLPASRGPWSRRAAAAAAASPAPADPADHGSDDGETLLPAESTLFPDDSGPAWPTDDRPAPFESFTTEPPMTQPPAPSEDGDLAATTGYDHLWGATVIRSVEDAAVREEEPDEHHASASPVPAEPADAGDHDGATISLAQVRAMRTRRESETAASPVSSVPAFEAAPGLIEVPSMIEVPAAPLAAARPPAPGRLRLSTGQAVTLDRTVVIGRRPRSTRVTGTDLPHLVAVDSPQGDISRSHLELRVEGDAIVATDLRTTNGTTLRRPGVDPVRLHPGEGTVVVHGDVLDLGDGILVSIEEMG